MDRVRKLKGRKPEKKEEPQAEEKPMEAPKKDWTDELKEANALPTPEERNKARKKLSEKLTAEGEYYNSHVVAREIEHDLLKVICMLENTRKEIHDGPDVPKTELRLEEALKEAGNVDSNASKAQFMREIADELAEMGSKDKAMKVLRDAKETALGIEKIETCKELVDEINKRMKKLEEPEKAEEPEEAKEEKPEEEDEDLSEHLEEVEEEEEKESRTDKLGRLDKALVEAEAEGDLTVRFRKLVEVGNEYLEMEAKSAAKKAYTKALGIDSKELLGEKATLRAKMKEKGIATERISILTPPKPTPKRIAPAPVAEDERTIADLKSQGLPRDKRKELPDEVLEGKGEEKPEEKKGEITESERTVIDPRMQALPFDYNAVLQIDENGDVVAVDEDGEKTVIYEREEAEDPFVSLQKSHLGHSKVIVYLWNRMKTAETELMETKGKLEKLERLVTEENLKTLLEAVVDEKAGAIIQTKVQNMINDVGARLDESGDLRRVIEIKSSDAALSILNKRFGEGGDIRELITSTVEEMVDDDGRLGTLLLRLLDENPEFMESLRTRLGVVILGEEKKVGNHFIDANITLVKPVVNALIQEHDEICLQDIVKCQEELGNDNVVAVLEGLVDVGMEGLKEREFGEFAERIYTRAKAILNYEGDEE